MRSPTTPHHRSSSTTTDEPLVPRSVGRVLDLLEIVLDGRHNLTGAAAAAGLTPTTALRHLRALEARGYVARDAAGVYAAGPTVSHLADTLGPRGRLARLVGAAQPLLDELALTTGESTYLAVRDGDIATYVASAESDRAIRHVGWIGQTVSLDGTAVGDALRSIGDVVTRTGAVEPDITAMSLAIGDVGEIDAPGVAVSVIGPSHRFGDTERSRHAEAIRHVVGALSARLDVTREPVAS